MNDTTLIKLFTFNLNVVDKILTMRSLSSMNSYVILYQESDRLWLKYQYQPYCPKCLIRRCLCVNGVINLDFKISRYYLQCNGSYPQNKN